MAIVHDDLDSITITISLRTSTSTKIPGIALNRKAVARVERTGMTLDRDDKRAYRNGSRLVFRTIAIRKLLQDKQQVICLNLAARLYDQLSDLAVAICVDDGFHLHRFQS